MSIVAANTDLASIATLTEFEELEVAAEGNTTIQAIVSARSHCASLDIQETFKRLIFFGNLLYLAYQAAGSQPCSSSILKVMSQYQTMVSELGSTTFSFVQSCMRALKVHDMMKLSFEKNKPEIAFKKHDELSKKAKENSKAAMKMHDTIKALIDLGEEALESARDDCTIQEADKRKKTFLISECRARRDALEKSVHLLGEQIEEARVEEEKHAKIAKEERDKQFGELTSITALMGAVQGTTDGAAAADAKESQAAASRWRLAQQQAQERATLLKHVAKLETMEHDRTEIKQVAEAILYLGSAIPAMGQIQATFQQVSKFWDNVSKQCDNSLNMAGNVKDVWDLNKDEMLHLWQQSVAGWAALGSVNLKAWRAMRAAGEDIDSKMNNLRPLTAKERANLAKQLSLEEDSTQKTPAVAAIVEEMVVDEEEDEVPNPLSKKAKTEIQEEGTAEADWFERFQEELSQEAAEAEAERLRKKAEEEAARVAAAFLPTVELQRAEEEAVALNAADLAAESSDEDASDGDDEACWQQAGLASFFGGVGILGIIGILGVALPHLLPAIALGASAPLPYVILLV